MAKEITGTAYRFQSDLRQFGGMLMLLSFACVIMPLYNISAAFGPDGAASTDPSKIPLWGLIAGIFVFIFGVTGVFVGYMVSVHDYTNKMLNLFLMVLIQTAWIGYITDMVAVGMGSRAAPEENGFIPLAYEPTAADVRFVGAMGVIAIMVYGFGFVGSMAFMVWSIHAYTIEKAEDRCGCYFRGRLRTYSATLAIGGLVQFLLGCYCQAHFAPYTNFAENGPVHVAFLIVSYPGISIFVGLLQMINGVWGIARSFHLALMTGPIYQISLGFQWLMVLILQVITQIAPATGANFAQATPFLAAFSLGLTLMPAYLDHKTNTVPDELPIGYYDEMNKGEEKAQDLEANA